MPRVEVISRFFLALASSLFLFISGVSLPPLGMIILPFVAQPVLVFGLKYGVVACLGVICLSISAWIKLDFFTASISSPNVSRTSAVLQLKVFLILSTSP